MSAVREVAPGAGERLVQRDGAPGGSNRLGSLVRWARERWWFLLLLALCAALIVPPLVMMVWTSLTPGTGLSSDGEVSFSAYADVVASDSFGDVVVDTVVFTVASSVGSIILGSCMAWFVARTDMVGKRLIYVSVFLSFAIPGMIEAIGWILLFGEGAGIGNRILSQLFGFALPVQSMTGMILVQTLSWAPMVFLLLVGPFQTMDGSLEESARVSGASRRVLYRRITLPILAPSIFSVLILVVIRAVQAFEIPLFLGTPAGVSTFTTEIYGRLRSSYIPDYAEAAAFGTILVVLLMAALVCYHRVTRTASSFATMTGKAYRPARIALGPWRWLVGAVAGLLFLLYLAPVIAMLVSSFWPDVGQNGSLGAFTLENYESLGDYRALWSGVGNSLAVGIIAATGATLLCGAAAFVVIRSAMRGRQVLDHLLSIPMVIPGTVLGLAFLVTYLRVPLPIYGSIWILVLAYIAHYSPYGMRYLQPALVQVGRDIDDAARVAGARGTLVFRRVLLPLVMPAVVGAWIYVFFHAFRDVSVASMVYTANTPVVATQLLDMWQDGVFGLLSAYGTALSLVSIAVGGVAFAFAQRMSFRG